MEFLRRTLVFVGLLLVQVLVLNRIQLFHCATPLLYVYFVVMLPLDTTRWAALLWSFALGLAVDVFSNTPGVAAASMTLIGMLQPSLLPLFLPRDAEEHLASAASTLGWMKFLTLATILVIVYCVVFFTLEAFTFFNWLYWLECVGGSALLTLLLIATLESLRR